MRLDTKYRPRRFSEVLSQDHITEILGHQILKGTAQRSYLFEGPTGSGKTTISRIFAKACLCSNRSGIDPCGACETCKGVDSGNSSRYVELDSATYGGVDVIREIRDLCSYAGFEGSRFIVLDECHMLSYQSQNTLLKLLEELRTDVSFIFCTTDPDKVLDTLRGRCMRFRVSKVASSDIRSRIKLICEIERIPFTEEALDLLVEESSGFARNALVFLDQVFLLGAVTFENVGKVIGMDAYEHVYAYIDAFSRPDFSAFKKTITSAHGKISLDRFYKVLCEVLSAIFSYKYFGNIDSRKIALPVLKGLATRISDKELYLLISSSLKWRDLTLDRFLLYSIKAWSDKQTLT